MESTLGVKYGLILALRSQIFEYLRIFFCRHALEVPEIGSFRGKKIEKKVFSYGNAWALLTFLKTCGLFSFFPFFSNPPADG